MICVIFNYKISYRYIVVGHRDLIIMSKINFPLNLSAHKNQYYKINDHAKNLKISLTIQKNVMIGSLFILLLRLSVCKIH